MYYAITVALAVLLTLFVCLRELPSSLAFASNCFSVPRVLLLPLMLLAFASGLYFGVGMPPFGHTPTASDSLVAAIGGGGLLDLGLVMASTLFVLLVLGLLGRKAAFIPSLCAALAGKHLFAGDALPEMSGLASRWLAAMALAFVAGMLISQLGERLLRNSKQHLFIKLSHLGFAMDIALLLLLFAVGFNFSVVYALLPVPYATEWLCRLGFVVLATLVFALLAGNFKPLVANAREDYSDTDALSSLACVAATALTMLVFARGPLLSPAVLLLCALAGARYIRTADLIVSALLAPFFALLVSYTASAIATAVQMGEKPAVAEAVAGLLAIVCCALAAMLLRSRRMQTAKANTNGGMEESYRRLNEMKVHSMQVENEHLQNLLAIRRRDAMSIAERISEQSAFIDELSTLVAEAESAQDVARKDEILHGIRSSLSLRRNSNDERTDFYEKVEALHQDFSARLTEKCPQLSAQERKLATLLRLEFSSKYIATLLNISPKSVEVERHRLRKKFGLSRDKNLIEYIKSI